MTRTVQAALAALALVAAAATTAHANTTSLLRPSVGTLWTSDATDSGDGQSHLIAIDPSTGKETARIGVGAEAEPWSIALTRNGRTAYVANFHNGTLGVVDTSARKMTTAVPLGIDADYVALSGDQKYAYVTSMVAQQLAVVDTAAKRLVKTVTLPGPAEGAAVSPDGRTVYVGVYSRHEVLALDTRTGAQHAVFSAGGPSARRVRLSPDGKQLYATDYYGGTVDVYNTAHPAQAPRKVPVGGRPLDLALSPDDRTLYVSDTRSGLAAINTRTLKARQFAVTPSFGDLAVSMDGKAVYLAQYQSTGSVSALDAGSGEVTGTFGDGLVHPNGLALGRTS
ncbi:YncE family protein [Streptomyces broussonetiae]|uniref:PQQ-binding-like beta-propeller repeat protein n=1 Tax=Streptomyces broussonetiae TaxID=2686304 RepID=A0A6I6N725_9ACTN|nr:YncE family protein [Streptomyces broussonetiae]QHA09008.1 PQQ-binding-like beta-propeller repeat protein [Streptomyces broussonetiae]